MRPEDQPASSTRVWSPRAVLFDLDATLIDSRPVWQGAYPAWAGQHGWQLPRDWWSRVAGCGLTESVALLAPADAAADTHALADELVTLATDVLARDGIEAMPGARALLEVVARAGLPFGVVTGSWRRFAAMALTHLDVEPGVLVCGDDGHAAKPDPAGYRLACTQLGADPAQVLVVEDSPSGVEAARAAGCRVLAAPSGRAIASEPDVRVVTDLATADPRTLLRWPAG